MSGSVAVVFFVVSILLVILIHEAAHFGMAKLFKIKVEEFFVGFGPKLWSVRRGETEYGVKALPLGGYVRIAGMNPFQEPTPEEYPRTFGAKPAWQRALVIFAGPATHFVIAFLILVGLLAFAGVPSSSKPVILNVEPKLGANPSPAAAAGLRAGDEVIAVDGIDHPNEQQLIGFTKRHVGRSFTVTVLRDGRRVSFTVTPVVDPRLHKGRIGVGLGEGTVTVGPVTAVTRAASATGRVSWQVIKRLGQVFGPQGISRVFELLFGGAQRKPTDVTSVVGVGRVVSEAPSFSAVLGVLASVNIFVGILNLVPLPPFDGGHLAVVGYEKIRRRKVDMRRLVPVTAVVAAFLVVFMLSVLYLDIVKPIPNVFR
jgi:membrane-associated protease RseP (regulator of RpoE activity)